MIARKLAIALAALLTLGPLGAADGCEKNPAPEATAAPGNRTAAPAPPGPSWAEPNPGQGAPAPAADPCACDPSAPGAKAVEANATWVSETKAKPTIHFTIKPGGGQPQPVVAGEPLKDKAGFYHGLWRQVFYLTPGQTLSFELFGTGSFTQAACWVVVYGEDGHEARQVNPQTTNRNCTSFYTHP